jgi:glyceraldehyde-3-phosphate dehydrogenase/erythrose-4-phosphate dehydrogenase
MNNDKDINLQSTKRQKRILPEDSFGDWKWREGLAESMVPLIGALYRNGINILIYGKSLVNESPVGIMKAHRFARQSDNNELSELETHPLLEYISTLNLQDCEIDIGEIAVKCPFFDDIKDNISEIPNYINSELESVINKDSSRPSEPKNIVLYGFGRIGRLVARMMTQTTGPGNYFRLRAIVIRKAIDNDIFKRASLLTKDSVHGPFDGTVRVDEDNSCLVINGNPVKVIYASDPEEVNYNDYGINDGHIETVHAYTNDQNLIDNFHKKDRRGRGAPLNMVITSTGAVKAVAKALPELDGKLTGNAIRVPTPNVSLAILSLTLDKKVTNDVVNDYLRSIAFHSKYREIIGFVNSTEIVSTDFYSSPFATIVDSQATISSGNKLTLYCWYDNEYGYSKQVISLAKKVANINLPRLPKPVN